MTPLYRRLLGGRFDDLPPQVAALHDVGETVSWTGRADVERGSSMAARAIATVLRLPPAGRALPLTVTFTPKGEAEVWTRTFGSSRFVSTQRAAGGELHETVGPVTLRMTLQQDAGYLGLSLIGARFLGIPVPGFLLPRIRTRESEDAGRYRFDVEAVVPAFGLLVRYQGWLERSADDP
jgi:Domain of unknown function (DUF4166)